MDQIVKIEGIDWDAKILDIWDREIPVDPKGEERMTLRFAVVEALGGAYPGEEAVLGEERVSRWSLATKIKDGSPSGLKAEDTALIKKLVNKRWPQPFIVGQIYGLIDPGERS
jgi:hypothetical protein